MTPNTVWADYGTSYSYPQVLPGSNREERWVAFSNYSGLVTSPGNDNPIYYNEYYVSLVSPIPVFAIINNTNSSLNSGWYIQGSKIYLEKLPLYLSRGERDVVSSVLPSQNITVVSPITVTVSLIRQYYVRVNSTVPVYAIVNNTNETLGNGWYDNGTVIHVENATYYPSQGVRYVMTSVTPSDSIVVTAPVTVIVGTRLEYLLTVESAIPVMGVVGSKVEVINTS